MSASRDAAIASGGNRSPRSWMEPVSWAVVALLLLAAGLRAATRPNPYVPGAQLPRMEDRRDHRFRDLTYVQAQRLLDGLMRAADRAPDTHQRALALARAAALQHERGYQDFADRAAREAVRMSPDDPEVRRALVMPPDLQELRGNK